MGDFTESGAEADAYLAHANGFKDAGNAAFQRGDVDTAISLYSQAISLNPDDPVYYSNRSAAYMKASHVSKALRDAEKCVELKPQWSKGFNRLGVAQQGLKRYDQAVASFKSGLQLEPDNAAIQEALRVCEEEQRQDRAERFQQAAKDRAAEESSLRIKEELKRNAANIAVSKPSSPEVIQSGDCSDPLASFFSSIKEASSVAEEKGGAGDKSAFSSSSSSTATITTSAGGDKGAFNEKYQTQDLGTALEQHTRLTARNYEFRNLNPFWVLQLGTDATAEDIKQRYRKLSTKVHPDKNRDVPDARIAFEAVKLAYQRLQDEDQRSMLVRSIDAVEEDARRAFEAGLSQVGGTSSAVPGTTATATSLLEDVMKKAVLRHFADVEMARRRSEDLQRANSAREKMQAHSDHEKVQKELERERDWAEVNRREKRVASWRDFSKSAASGAGTETEGETGTAKKPKL
jgi:DnaJ family protein C protein 8